MNEGHLQFLASPEWAQLLRDDLMPWVDALGDLGDDVLEIGPGPGLTTDLLRARVPRLTAIEVDADLARDLEARLSGTNVTVICADATKTDLPAGRFSSVACFTMLHHMPASAHQDALFAELHRLLRPTGRFVGADSLDLEPIRAAHVDDVFVPVPPNTLAARLESAGFTDVAIEVGDEKFRFVARAGR